VLTLGIYVVLGLACAGILFFVSVAVFGGSTTSKPPPGGPEAADAAGRPGSPGRARSDLALPARDAAQVEWPFDRAMTGADVVRLRIPVALRGYRMAETDAVLDRLREMRLSDPLLAREVGHGSRHLQ
jgi:hypothetical protein